MEDPGGIDGASPEQSQQTTIIARTVCLDGYLMRLDVYAHGHWLGHAYMHTCNGWQRLGYGRAAPHTLRHATVEPWPGDPDVSPDDITLVGPTMTHWAASRGLLEHGIY